jgi:hypothetical protein
MVLEQSQRARLGLALAPTVLMLGACGAWPGEEQSSETASSPGPSPTTSAPTPVTVTYEVDGIRDATVFYFDDRGEYVNKDVTLPWRIELEFDDISEAALISIVADQHTIVEPHMGTLACTVAIDGDVVVNDEDVPVSSYDDRHVECGYTEEMEES